MNTGIGNSVTQPGSVSGIGTSGTEVSGFYNSGSVTSGYRITNTGFGFTSGFDNLGDGISSVNNTRNTLDGWGNTGYENTGISNINQNNTGIINSGPQPQPRPHRHLHLGHREYRLQQRGLLQHGR